MEIKTKKDDKNLTITLEGRLDTNTSPELEEYLEELNSINNLTLDFEKLNYISSAGLRLILIFQKTMKNSNGTMVIKNVKEKIKEIFDITGFTGILTIEWYLFKKIIFKELKI